MRSTSCCDDLLGSFGFLAPLAQIGVDHFLQIVDVVEEDVVEIVDRGFDVAGHRNIDEEHGLVAASANHALHFVFMQDVVRRAAGSDQDIHFRQHVDEAAVLDRRALKQLGHLDGAFVSAVGDEDVRSAGTPQVPGGEFRHLARPGDHDGAVVQRTEDFARQFDGGVAD